MNMSIEKASEEYVFKRKHGKIHIKKYIGSGGAVEIPQFIGGMPVTKIDSFYNSAVTEIIIPDGVRIIGTGAFLNCSELKKVTFQGRIDVCDYDVFSNTALEEIIGIDNLSGTNIRTDCFYNTPFYQANETLIIGDSLIWCREENEIIKVSDNIKKIGYMAFYKSKAKKIILPEGLRKIENLAFYGAEIREMRIPENVEKVGGNIFCYCDKLEKVTLPQDFGRRVGWDEYLGISANALNSYVINDTQLYPTSDEDVLIYNDVSCIVCDNAIRYNPPRLRDKQIFPKRLEYLKCVRLLASARVNVFRNDTFQIERNESIFDNMFWKALNSRRFTIAFELGDCYSEVLFYFPFMPYLRDFGGRWYWAENYYKNSDRDLISFYDSCFVNSSDGRFFDFDIYDGHILEQDIPFRIKAEIAYKRLSSNYRLSSFAREKYIQYFMLHRKKLKITLDKLQNNEINDFFDEFVLF